LVGVYGYRVCSDDCVLVSYGLRRFKACHELFTKGQSAKNPRKYCALYRNVFVYGDKLSWTAVGCIQQKGRIKTMKLLEYDRIFIVGAVCFALFFLALNIYTPLIADDFSFSLGVRSSVGDFLKQLYNRYIDWTGRTVVIFLTQF
jgi:hypothetical protein